MNIPDESEALIHTKKGYEIMEPLAADVINIPKLIRDFPSESYVLLNTNAFSNFLIKKPAQGRLKCLHFAKSYLIKFL